MVLANALLEFTHKIQVSCLDLPTRPFLTSITFHRRNNSLLREVMKIGPSAVVQTIGQGSLAPNYSSHVYCIVGVQIGSPRSGHRGGFELFSSAGLELRVFDILFYAFISLIILYTYCGSFKNDIVPTSNACVRPEWLKVAALRRYDESSRGCSDWAVSIAISDASRDISEKATFSKSRSASRLSARVFICKQ